MKLGEMIEFLGTVMDVAVGSPSMRRCPRNQPVRIMLGRDPAVLRGSLELLGDRVKARGGVIAWIGHQISSDDDTGFNGQ